ncbi:MAG: SET domain-containing protein-lysine N-methyltransferase [Gemmatimonadaceae bacterium]
MRKKHVAAPQPFEIRGSAIQGRGAFATRAIRKGERVAEYGGERISWKEADKRYDDTGMGRHHTFLFAVTSRTVIDGAVNGTDARFINHSCDPNCEAVDDRGRIYIDAIRAIAPGEELAYDYAYERDATHTPEDEALYVCRCGSRLCRGTILAPPPKSLSPTHHAAARHWRRLAEGAAPRKVPNEESTAARRKRPARRRQAAK